MYCCVAAFVVNLKLPWPPPVFKKGLMLLGVAAGVTG